MSLPRDAAAGAPTQEQKGQRGVPAEDRVQRSRVIARRATENHPTVVGRAAGVPCSKESQHEMRTST